MFHYTFSIFLQAVNRYVRLLAVFKYPAFDIFDFVFRIHGTIIFKNKVHVILIFKKVQIGEKLIGIQYMGKANRIFEIFKLY